MRTRETRKSLITEHNQFQETDNLYEPLRNTINRSISKSKLGVSNISGVSDLRRSSVSKRIHQLGPDEAEHMQRQIYIPINRKLKPTGDHALIEGRRFVAIESTQHTNQPISQSDFKRLYHGQHIKETVYQLQSKQSSSKQTPVQNYGYIQRETNDARKRNTFYSPDPYRTTFGHHQNSQPNAQYLINKQQKQTVVSRPSSRYYQTYINNDRKSSNTKYYMRQSNNKPSQVVSNRNSNLNRVTSEDNFKRINPQNNQYNSEYKNMQTDFSKYRNSRVQEEKNSRTNSNRINQKQDQSRLPQIDFKDITGKNDSRVSNRSNKNQQATSYKFRSGSRTGTNSNTNQADINAGNKLRAGKSKQPYKYNLFSAIDEGVNTKCSSFGKNQIVARRPDHKKWQ